jgi:hypothetical protein
MLKISGLLVHNLPWSKPAKSDKRTLNEAILDSVEIGLCGETSSLGGIGQTPRLVGTESRDHMFTRWD